MTRILLPNLFLSGKKIFCLLNTPGLFFINTILNISRLYTHVIGVVIIYEKIKFLTSVYWSTDFLCCSLIFIFAVKLLTSVSICHSLIIFHYISNLVAIPRQAFHDLITKIWVHLLKMFQLNRFQKFSHSDFGTNYLPIIFFSINNLMFFF